MKSQSNSRYSAAFKQLAKAVCWVTVILALLILEEPAAQSAPKVKLVPIDFLGGFGPGKMNARNFHRYFGDSIREPMAPVGGALVKVDKPSSELYLYIFCDPPLNRLVIFSEERTCGEIHPAGIKEYGLNIQTTHDSAGYTFPNLAIPSLDTDGVLVTPVDVAVSSGDGFYNPSRDFIFIVDQSNHRIVKLRYDIELDSLVWSGTFGGDSLRLPTAVAYGNYGANDSSDDKIYVSDADRHAIIRFSARGNWETYWEPQRFRRRQFKYPNGLVTARGNDSLHTIYIAELHFGTVTKLCTNSKGIIYDVRQISMQYPHYGVATPDLGIDNWGNVYLVNEMHNSIVALTESPKTPNYSFDSTTISINGLYFPTSIQINGDEMIVCESWGDSTGIASFKIVPDTSLPETVLAPRESHLYVPYPFHFSATTKLSFDVTAQGRVQILIVDKAGSKVKTILDNNVPAGNSTVVWNGQDDSGKQVEPGLYYCKMITSGYQAAKPVLYIR